eukprot:Skav229352  [mRNA]  locus=scaffold3209:768:1496:- [translate_table: standard]
MAKPLLGQAEDVAEVLSFEIKGMHCKSCVKKVETALKDLDLLSVKLELQAPTGRLEVSVDPKRVEEVAHLVQTAVESLDLQISPAGHQAGPSGSQASLSEPFEFEVLGMKCGSCVNKAEKAIRAVPWPPVSEVRVNLLSESAQVRLQQVMETSSEVEEAAKALQGAFQSVGLEATVTKKPLPTRTASRYEGGSKVRRVFEFEVIGMKCGSCVKKAETALRAIASPQVVDVNVNLLAESAMVD